MGTVLSSYALLDSLNICLKDKPKTKAEGEEAHLSNSHIHAFIFDVVIITLVNALYERTIIFLKVNIA